MQARAYDRLDPPATVPERRALDGLERENLVRAPCGSEARPLIGIWVTAPFLHNGSVPTLHDLLSPTRPVVFTVSDRKFDPEKVGYRTDRREFSTLFHTTLTDNSNVGIGWGTRQGQA